MVRLTLYWEFFKSTLVFNLASSVLLAIIIYMALKIMPDPPPPIQVVYIKCCMFGGPILCFLYNEMSRKEEYYFYFNRGVSKISLIVVTLSTYVITGYLLINILRYAKLA